MRQIVIFLFFLISFLCASGQEAVKQLFKERKFKDGISVLKKKMGKEELTLDEYFYLARACGRIRQYTNGMFYFHDKKYKKAYETYEVSEKDKLWLAIILLLTFITLLSMLFLFKYRNMRAAHENVLIEQKLLRSQMTPHFIFNSLSILQGMILNNENEKATKYLSKFSRLLRLNLENSREKFVSIQEELEAIQSYVDLQRMRSKNSFKYKLSLDKELEGLKLLIPPMLIQPFVENAIEHGIKKGFKNAVISIEITYKDAKLVCVIMDNGIGIDKNNTSSEKKSLSTKITSKRLKLLAKGRKKVFGIKVEDRSKFNKQGTQVTLEFPFKIV